MGGGTMMIIPFQLKGHERGPLVVFVVLEKENLDRMRKADPCDMQFATYSSMLPTDWPIAAVDLVICYEEHIGKLMTFKAQNDIPGLLKWLERGRVNQPGDGTAPVRL